MTRKLSLLSQSIEQLELMNRVLENLRTEDLPKNAKMFAVMAEDPLEEIQRLHDDIQRRTAALVQAV